MRWIGLSPPLREAETLEDSEHTSGISSVFAQLAGESLNVGMHLWFIRVWECRYWQDGDFHARFCLLFVSIFPVLVPLNFAGLFWQSLKQNAKQEFATCILFSFFLERRLRNVHHIAKNMWTANTTPVCACWTFNYKTIGINGETVLPDSFSFSGRRDLTFLKGHQ